MKYPALLFLAWLLSPAACAQAPDPVPNDVLKINLLRSLHQGALLWEHRVREGRSVEIGLGYYYPNDRFYTISVEMLDNTFCFRQGPELLLSWNFNKAKNEKRWRSWQLFANTSYQFFKNAAYWTGGLGGSSYYHTLYIDQQIYQLNPGARFSSCTVSGSFFSEFFTGISLATGYARTTEIGCSRKVLCPDSELPRDIERVRPGTGPFIGVKVHLGIKLGGVIRK